MGRDAAALSILVDSRMAARGLGISTFAHRLLDELAVHPAVTLTRWQAPGDWGRRAQWATLGRSGLFDVAPRLDPRTRSFDVVHYLSNIASLYPGAASVVTVHDLMHRRARRSRDRLSGFLLEQGLTRAGRLVAVSTRTAAEVTQSWPALAERIVVIPHGMRRLPWPAGARSHLVAFGGGSDPRKRVDLMVAAYQRYREADRNALPLVVLARAGLTEGQRSTLVRLGADIRDRASTDEVDRLMAAAAALIYPTTTEGFGLPILEAAEVGTPVVMDRSADVASEVRGRHCVVVDGVDPDRWAAAIGRAVATGPVVAALDLPDWTEVAQRYVDLYRQLAGGRMRDR